MSQTNFTPRRSYMGPKIPVRLNRAIVLRRLMASHRGDDVGSLSGPPKAEVGNHVTGLNKAVYRGLQRHLTTWFREQNLVLQRMDRHQNKAYENLVRLQNERENLVSYVSMLRQSTPHRPPVKIVLSEDNHDDQNQANENDSLEEQKAKDNVKNEPDSEDSDAPNSKHVNVTSAGSTSKLPRLIEKKDEHKIKQFSAPNERENRSILKNEQELKTTLNDSKSVKAQSCTSLYGKTTTDHLPKIQKRSLSSVNLLTSHQTEMSEITRSANNVYLDIGGSHLVPGQDFVCYQKSPRGDIIQAEFPYKPRRFRSPRKKDPLAHQALIKTEENAQNKHKEKYSLLQKGLQDLEHYNPLDDIRHLFHQTEDANKNVTDNRPLDFSMRHLVQAFAQDYNKYLLDGLDPNSPEALKLCQYLRLKEEDQELRQHLAFLPEAGAVMPTE